MFLQDTEIQNLSSTLYFLVKLGIQYHLCTLFIEEQSHLSVVSLGTRKCKLIWMSQCNSLSQTTLVFVYDCNHDLTSLSPCSEVGNGNPLQCSCLENYMDGEAWQGTVHGSQRVRYNCLWLRGRQSLLLFFWPYFIGLFVLIQYIISFLWVFFDLVMRKYYVFTFIFTLLRDRLANYNGSTLSFALSRKYQP